MFQFLAKKCARYSISARNVRCAARHQRNAHSAAGYRLRQEDDERERVNIGGSNDDRQTSEKIYDQLYPHHICTTPLQKAILTVGSGAIALFAPWRGDMVATFGETTASLALKGMKEKMQRDVVGRQILQEQPRINMKTLDLPYLESLPDDTFGYAYATNFLKRYNLNPDDRPPVEFIDDAQLWYVMTRYREVHDLLHTLLGMPTNMLGEVAVKWFEGLQTGLPMCVLGSMFSPMRFGPKFSRLYATQFLPWALNTGRNANFYMNVYFEKEFEKPMDVLRNEMGIPPPPQM
ncbi:PREDICTED: ubiquinone biosynthesis protein COQ4 homolog, mitochondrial-like [Priapulus caudatus]|uniref:Ubiquinone biosynthesis protein COQ4 homolog, mitochondrial n=1 Tax=Priapulus caudatus TaxID=37621 RepID=A0ABM1EBK6_PRICU|nr:PREDICTED: ubiquinone biosynthesis protein COQ4 homolog, mitochondrial-like [Priapulus caudatus]